MLKLLEKLVSIFMSTPTYHDALYNLIPIGDNQYISIITWIMRQIDASKYGFIKLDVSDLKNALGPEFLEKKDSTIYDSIRNVMKKYKIKVRYKKKNKNGDLILILEDPAKSKSIFGSSEKKNDAMLLDKIATLENKISILENEIETFKKNDMLQRIEIIDKEDTMFCR